MCWWAEFPRFKLLELSVVAHLDAFKVQDHDKLSFDASGMSALLMREIDNTMFVSGYTNFKLAIQDVSLARQVHV